MTFLLINFLFSIFKVLKLNKTSFLSSFVLIAYFTMQLITDIFFLNVALFEWIIRSAAPTSTGILMYSKP